MSYVDYALKQERTLQNPNRSRTPTVAVKQKVQPKVSTKKVNPFETFKAEKRERVYNVPRIVDQMFKNQVTVTKQYHFMAPKRTVKSVPKVRAGDANASDKKALPKLD